MHRGMSALQHAVEIHNMQCSTTVSNSNFSKYCRSQLKKRDEEYAGLQSVHDAVKSQLEHQNSDLSAKLSKVFPSRPCKTHEDIVSRACL